MVVCKICGHKSGRSLQAHINHKHGLINKEYLKRYPDAQIYSQDLIKQMSESIANRDPSYKEKLSESTKNLYKNPEWVKKHNRALSRAQNSAKSSI